MRSRYTAHVRGDVEYIVRTTLPEQQSCLDREAIGAWARGSTWLGLEILGKQLGEEGDREGLVEFRADFEAGGRRQSHRERSRFRRQEGRWFFDGRPAAAPSVRAQKASETGRNDPCPCGSGNKHKRCCGR